MWKPLYLRVSGELRKRTWIEVVVCVSVIMALLAFNTTKTHLYPRAHYHWRDQFYWISEWHADDPTRKAKATEALTYMLEHREEPLVHKQILLTLAHQGRDATPFLPLIRGLQQNKSEMVRKAAVFAEKQISIAK
ncbi:MAG: hypothetical protein JWN70_2155 [Planctomycetaceae bacterium]|nr:hypothetical protein [Planctomycetaceae bacterium]